MPPPLDDEDLSDFLDEEDDLESRISVREIFLDPPLPPPSEVDVEDEARPPGREVDRCMVKRLMLNGMAVVFRGGNGWSAA